MTRGAAAPPRRVLITLDAVGGVSRYAVDLALTLESRGTEILLVGLGPRPDAADLREIDGARNVAVQWTDLPLDWMVADSSAIAGVPDRLLRTAEDFAADLLHLNLPSQASDTRTIPTVVASHSCFATWWHAVRHPAPPPDLWAWHHAATAAGFRHADAVIAPSEAHACALRSAYGDIRNLEVARNGSAFVAPRVEKEMFAVSLGRWWDDAKNAAAVDSAARDCRIPILMGGSISHEDGSRFVPYNAKSLGQLPRVQTVDMLGRAAIFISPALYEPFGLAVLEAARARCALVLSDIPTFRELWEDAAVFIDPHDPRELARAVATLADNSAHRHALSEAAFLRSGRYSLEAQADRMQSIYAGALAREAILTEAV